MPIYAMTKNKYLTSLNTIRFGLLVHLSRDIGKGFLSKTVFLATVEICKRGVYIDVSNANEND